MRFQYCDSLGSPANLDFIGNVLESLSFFIRARFLFFCFLSLAIGCGGVSKETVNHYASGTAYFQEKNLSAAIGEFQKVYRETPDYLSTRLMLGKCYFYSKELKKAKEIFEEDFDSNPSRLNSGIWWYRVRFILGEDPKEILPGVISILEIDPEKLEGWILRGLLEEKLGQNSDAVRSYLRASEDSERIAFVNYRLSKLFRAIRFPERAEKHAERARALGFEIQTNSETVK
ncbi:tetratricopeptide repeat protein [Leptospira inadai serovar Lyme str. 10]|uniref:Tetratricopeptide repeat protein n=1 Tax=Leptospira inadai serovar Lyme str. 10 TaxID=1049790 RepID=V6I004_9LEPT|nr:tetratricopeptide repeat protein [Leptospira inadai]EQA38594.1 tetratricopeptide repeat protein [Leptospira inadai serovar Lyme str. 10]